MLNNRLNVKIFFIFLTSIKQTNISSIFPLFYFIWFKETFFPYKKVTFLRSEKKNVENRPWAFF